MPGTVSSKCHGKSPQSECESGRITVTINDRWYNYESITDGTPFLTQENRFLMLEGFRRLRRLAASDAHIVPGHDPDVLNRYAAPSPEMEGIVVRLDEPPCH